MSRGRAKGCSSLHTETPGADSLWSDSQVLNGNYCKEPGSWQLAARLGSPSRPALFLHITGLSACGKGPQEPLGPPSSSLYPRENGDPAWSRDLEMPRVDGARTKNRGASSKELWLGLVSTLLSGSEMFPAPEDHEHSW